MTRPGLDSACIPRLARVSGRSHAKVAYAQIAANVELARVSGVFTPVRGVRIFAPRRPKIGRAGALEGVQLGARSGPVRGPRPGVCSGACSRPVRGPCSGPVRGLHRAPCSALHRGTVRGLHRGQFHPRRPAPCSRVYIKQRGRVYRWTGAGAHFIGTREIFSSKLACIELLFYICPMFNTISTLPAPVLAAIAGALFVAVSFGASIIQANIQK